MLACTLALIAVPITMSPQPSPRPAADVGATALRADDPAGRSATRAPVATPAAGTPEPTPTLVDEIVTRTNAERVTAGLPALTVSACATEQAEARTATLAREDRFEHDPLQPVLDACGAHRVAENLALGYPTALAVVAGWMGSDGHRENMLGEAYTQIGVACATGPRGLLCAQVFLG
ncbi:CAP domain-containing protein [Cellulomonas sp. P5_C6]